MTLFIEWPIEQDAEFRAAYKQVVGETIQDDPLQQDNMLVVGSSRATVAHMAVLQAQGFDVVFNEA